MLLDCPATLQESSLLCVPWGGRKRYHGYRILLSYHDFHAEMILSMYVLRSESSSYLLYSEIEPPSQKESQRPTVHVPDFCGYLVDTCLAGLQEMHRAFSAQTLEIASGEADLHISRGTAWSCGRQCTYRPPRCNHSQQNDQRHSLSPLRIALTHDEWNRRKRQRHHACGSLSGRLPNDLRTA
jgi:hypothetical protein